MDEAKDENENEGAAAGEGEAEPAGEVWLRAYGAEGKARVMICVAAAAVFGVWAAREAWWAEETHASRVVAMGLVAVVYGVLAAVLTVRRRVELRVAEEEGTVRLCRWRKAEAAMAAGDIGYVKVEAEGLAISYYEGAVLRKAVMPLGGVSERKAAAAAERLRALKEVKVEGGPAE